MSATVLLAQAVTTAGDHEGLPSKWVFGAFALVALLGLLYVTTRFNADR